MGRRDEAGRVSRGWAGPGADADCGAGPRPASIVCALAGQLPCFCFCLCGSCVVSVCRSYVLSLVCGSVPAYIAVDFRVLTYPKLHMYDLLLIFCDVPPLEYIQSIQQCVCFRLAFE